MMQRKTTDLKSISLPPSCRGPDGKLRQMTEDEHRQYIESALRRIDEVEQIPDEPSDPPEEEWMRVSFRSVHVDKHIGDVTVAHANQRLLYSRVYGACHRARRSSRLRASGWRRHGIHVPARLL